MGRAVKVAISLPAELLMEAEEARHIRGETRSEFFRRAIEDWLAREREQAADAEYVAAYRRCPETDDEVAAWSALALRALEQEPWE